MPLLSLARIVSNISPIIHAFFWLKYVIGKTLLSKPFRHLGFSDLFMTMGFSFLPLALTKSATVILILLFFPPLQAFPLPYRPSPFLQILYQVRLSKIFQSHPYSRCLPFCTPGLFLVASPSRNQQYLIEHLLINHKP